MININIRPIIDKNNIFSCFVNIFDVLYAFITNIEFYGINTGINNFFICNKLIIDQLIDSL